MNNKVKIKKSKCPFANFFGEPGKGIHAWRIGKFAAADILITIAAAYFISIKKEQNFAVVLTKLVALGIVLHRIFGVNTALNEMIFKDRICDQSQ